MIRFIRLEAPIVRARFFRAGAAICATSALLAGTAISLAAITGAYSGSGNAFTIGFDVKSDRVDGLNLACSRGATTVEATGHAAKVTNYSFTYTGPAASTTKHPTVHMKVTGTFTDKGKKVKGKASTSGACPSGSYTASK
jgi:hypothetical protein